MRSFLHHRIYAQGATKNVLFFGCRKRAMDYHYREEWEQLELEGSLQVFAACSRDQVKYTNHMAQLDHAFTIEMFFCSHHLQHLVLNRMVRYMCSI